MQQIETMQPLVAENSDCGRIKAEILMKFVETISLNSINNCGNTLKKVLISCNFFNNVPDHSVFYKILYIMRRELLRNFLKIQILGAEELKLSARLVR